jgi:hypothetical protein
MGKKTPRKKEEKEKEKKRRGGKRKSGAGRGGGSSALMSCLIINITFIAFPLFSDHFQSRSLPNLSIHFLQYPLK